jgi:methylthioribose-1-phosphate isomerase
MALQAIVYSRGKLQLLDQRLLPQEHVLLDVPTPQIAWKYIKDMVVRGAPAIGVTAALAMAVDLTNKEEAFQDVQDSLAYITSTLEYLVTRCKKLLWPCSMRQTKFLPSQPANSRQPCCCG